MELIIVLTATKENIEITDAVLDFFENNLNGECGNSKIRIKSIRYNDEDQDSVCGRIIVLDNDGCDVALVASCSKGTWYNHIFNNGLPSNPMIVETSVLYDSDRRVNPVMTELCATYICEIIEKLIP